MGLSISVRKAGADPPGTLASVRLILSDPKKAQQSDRAPAEAAGAQVSGPNGKSVVVIGAGLVGVATAYYLQSAGYRVTVVDEGDAPAEATSFANAGRFCPTRMCTYPLASPGVLINLAKSPFKAIMHKLENSNDEDRLLRATEDVPSSVALNAPLAVWGAWFARNCTPGKYAHNNAIFRRLTLMSREATADLLDAIPGGREGVAFAPSNVWVYGSRGQADEAVKLAQGASLSGFSNWTLLNCESCKKAHPALASFLDRAAAAPNMDPSCLVANDDYSVDANQFARRLASLTAEMHSRGAPRVDFSFRSRVVGLVSSEPPGRGQQLRAVQVEPVEAGRGVEAIAADHFVVCCGPQARPLMKRLCNMSLPIQGMKGCSVELYGVKNGPTASVADYMCGPLNFQATPVGPTTLRLIGFADFEPIEGLRGRADLACGPLQRVAPNEGYVERLLSRARLVFPEMTWESSRAPWCGVRPLTPDGLPIVGQSTAYSNLWLNVGHGSVGWSLASGTGLVLSRDVLASDGLLATGTYVADLTQRFGFQGEHGLEQDRFRWWRFLLPARSSGSSGSSF